MLFYNDFIGVMVRFVAEILGWAALGAVVLTGFWKAGLWVFGQGRRLLRQMKQEWKEATAE